MGSIRLGTSSNDIKEIKKVYIGSTEIKKICIGSTEIWSSGPSWSSLIESFRSSFNSNIDEYEEVYEDVANYDGWFHLFASIDGNLGIKDYRKQDYPTLINDISDFDFVDSYNLVNLENMGYAISGDTVYLIMKSDDFEEEEINEGSGYILLFVYNG